MCQGGAVIATITSQIHRTTVLVTLRQIITHIASQTKHHNKNITFLFYSVEILNILMSKGLTHATNNA